MRMNDRQRRLLADKLPDLANLVLAGAVFAQFVQYPKYVDVMWGGLALSVVLYVGASILVKGVRD